MNELFEYSKKENFISFFKNFIIHPLYMMFEKCLLP